ncbi:hypothetical protein L2D04_08435 [Pantoea agglomerans]|uniref:hypothetical protein n=1 Tax=Enterobacter agglomerans TaxID=549 RepID=UPI000F5F4E5F|nr:hypothetical protein [Pantoea agglomerans]AZI51793.1 hypothetical protein CBF16_13335 [Pantoea agglomerans]UJQ25078.1 hypothetical protein L2D04_08435 [Pantoea agglomerans]
MSRSTYSFDRWTPQSKSSWAWSVFKKHNNELLRMIIAFENSYKYTFSNLGASKANLSDSPELHFKFKNKNDIEKFGDLNEWVNSYNQLENWVNLNALVSLMSNLETYMATIIPLAVESDIGVLYGLPNRIDGIEIVKHNQKKPHGIEEIVTSCTKGTWGSRVGSYKKIFDKAPKYLEGHISELDKMRNLRNNVAHAFGRDIESAREKTSITILPSNKLSREKLMHYQSIVWKATKAIDAHLYNFHIGEYSRILFYHELQGDIDSSLHTGQKVMMLKKAIGRFGATPAGKAFCKGLIEYYDAI